MNPPVLSVQDLQVRFSTRQGSGLAVNGISFDLHKGETLGLVGESGCGKSMTALSILGLYPQPASRIVGGQILFKGDDLVAKTSREMQAIRGAHIALIPQDPLTALNPVFTVGAQIYEPLKLHRHLAGDALRARAVELLHLLRIPEPESRLKNYPHQFSGGMRQRVVGAIALSCAPEVLIADEPTTSLDVTVQAAYLKLLRDIQAETQLATLFITHDFGVVGKICDRVAVMYGGGIVEIARTKQLFEKPAHPYTEALLQSVPDVRVTTARLYSIPGQPPSIYKMPRGCAFAPRCPHVMPRCQQEVPPEIAVAPGQHASCWRYA